MYEAYCDSQGLFPNETYFLVYCLLLFLRLYDTLIRNTVKFGFIDRFETRVRWS